MTKTAAEKRFSVPFDGVVFLCNRSHIQTYQATTRSASASVWHQNVPWNLHGFSLNAKGGLSGVLFVADWTTLTVVNPSRTFT